ncbi:hypothetical protein BD309DRAFT_1079651 [Dichomitus squalens]|nr:hypothetical protein BD309DRAFT_1079651 [Dichomitus squalens]
MATTPREWLQSNGVDLSSGYSSNLQSALLVDTLKESNSALKDANAALKDLVSSLQSERDLLIDKNNKLVAQLARRLNPNEAANADRENRLSQLDLSKLPQEIVLRICLAAIPDKYQHDYSFAAGPRSPWFKWLNTRTALTLVCRAWNGPASEALYTDITFRRAGQIPALARTFRASAVVNAPNRARYVKRIYMDWCTVMSHCEKIVRDDLMYLLQHCTALKSFALRPHPVMWASHNPDAPIIRHRPHYISNPQWLLSKEGNPAYGIALASQCGAGLQELAFVGPLISPQSLNLFCLLQGAVHLKTLIFGAVEFPNVQIGSSQPPTPAQVALPRLEELQLFLHNDMPRLHNYICGAWHLPVLKRLTLSGCNFFPADILAKHGEMLEYLHLRFVPSTSSPWRDQRPEFGFSRIRRCCPHIQHLVVPFLPAYNLLCTIDSPTLRYLDMWGGRHKRRVVELMCELGRASELPSLRSVRILPSALAHILPQDVPLICHPTDVSDDEVRMRTFPAARVLQTSWALLTDCGMDWGVAFLDDEMCDDDSDGSNYEPEEQGANENGDGDDEDEDDGTSWVSDSEAGDLASDDDTALSSEEESGMEYDREAVLQRYAQSQQEDFLFDDDTDGEESEELHVDIRARTDI